jgi:osmotically-inducible protein OsmY
MPRILVCAVLLFLSTLATAQQQPPSSDPSSSDPNASQQPAQQPSPSQANPQDKASVNSQMQGDISSALSSDPSLSGTSVQASVDDINITLTGSVQSKAQMDRVLALVSPYARYRNVVNKVAVH